ncbi:MAG TPA: imidazole glycerol phosphate synthase subunit HisH [Methanosarcina sp.]|nr:imidazole glycerol phosphate synthase subunit HisH [Methanosarcina sp.]
MVIVIDLGISNLSSVTNALDYLNSEYIISNSCMDIDRSSHVILPGVGTFESGMKALRSHDLIECLQRNVINLNKPLLGICLGMHLLFSSSEESPGSEGLSFVSGHVEKLKKSSEYSIPRIGWCPSEFKKDFLCFKQGENIDFYYIHSYHVVPTNIDTITMLSGDLNPVVSGIQEGSIHAVQFHPEKSHHAGIQLLKSFLEV